MRNAMSQFLLITNLLFSSLLFGQIYLTNPNVEGNWVDTTYIVQSNIHVYNGDTLTIAPGATIKFDGNYVFQVRGSLFANGTETDSIIFEPNDPNNTSGSAWQGIKIRDNSWDYTHKVELSYFRISYASGNWPSGSLVVYNKYSDNSGVDSVMISHGLIHNANNSGVQVYGNRRDTNYGLAGTKPYVHLSNLHIHSCNERGLYIEYNYETEIKIDSLNIHDNNQEGVAYSYNYDNTMVSIDSIRLVNNYTGLYVYRLESGSKIKVRNGDFHSNQYNEISVRYLDQPENFSIRNSKIIDETADDGNYAVYAYDCCDNNDDLSNALDMRLNDWGTTVTGLMNSGTNPQDLDAIYDYYESSNYPLVNYASFVGANASNTGFSGELSVQNSSGVNLSNDVPIGTTQLSLHLLDPDLAGTESATVTVTSSVDADDEVVTLTESASRNGRFSGTINLSETTFRIIEDEEQFLADVAIEMENVSQENPDFSDDEVAILARVNVREVYFQDAVERYNNPQSTNSRDDGSLDVSGGAIITISYADATADWGATGSTITKTTVYGGVSGSLSGVLTAANSPYIITGDVFVEEDDTLTIEAGVTLKFFGMYEMEVKGDFHAVGAIRDSIYFVPFDASGHWSGLHFTHSYKKSVTLSYFSIKNGGSGSWEDSGLSVYNRYNHEGVHISHGDIFGAQDVAVFIGYNSMHNNTDGNNEWGEIELTNLKIHHNGNNGIYTYHNSHNRVTFDSLHIHDNEGNGFYSSQEYYPVETNLMNSTIENNGQSEIYVSYMALSDPNVQFHVNHNTIRDTVNMTWGRNHANSLVYTSGNNWDDDGSGQALDFRYNYWGGAATDSMNTGSIPRNLPFIRDWHDVSNYPLINYSNFVGATNSTGSTAELSFLTENGNLLEQLTANMDSLYLRVVDLDGGVSGGDSMHVSIESFSDSLGMVTLHEQGNSGVFLAAVPLSHGTFRINEGTEEEYNDRVQDRIQQLRLENPSWAEEQVMDRARLDIDDEIFDAALVRYAEEMANVPVSRTDGILNLTSQDVVTMTYVDALNDWGTSETLDLSVGYQAMYGTIMGPLTAENSPYVVRGDVWVNDQDSLFIEPGVEIIMSANSYFYVRGKLHAVGTEQDSIIFRGVNDRNGYWRYLSLQSDNWWNNQGRNSSSTLSYVQIKNAGSSNYGNGALEVRDRYGDVSINHVSITGTSNYALAVNYMRGQSNDSVDVHIHHLKVPYQHLTGIRLQYNNYANMHVSDVQIHNSMYEGIEASYNNYSDLHFVNIDIKNGQEEAMRIEHNQNGSHVKVELSNFVNNNQRYYSYGMIFLGNYDYTNGSVTFNNNNFIHDDSQWANYSNWYYVRVDAGGNGDMIDMTSNYWGPVVTAEMDSLGTRQNITRIYDYHDGSWRSEADYSNWLTSPMIRPVKVHVEDTYVAIGDTVLVAVDVIVPLDTSVISAELTLTGFQDHLNVVSVETAQGMAGAAGWSLASNATDTSLYIAAAGSTPISGRGTLLWVKLAAPATSSGGVAPVNVSNAVFDDGGFGFNADNGSVTIIQPLTVDFTLSADSGAYPLEVVFTSSTSGEDIAEYSWDFGDGMMSHDQNPVHTFLRPGNYSVALTCVDSYGSIASELKSNVVSVDTLFGDVDFNASVQAYDAGLILQNAVGFIELDDLQQHSGNVSGDTDLTSLDASLILQYVVHLIDELPHDSSDGHLLATGDFGLHDQIFAPGHVIEVPIYFNQASNVYSIEGLVEYNPAHISYQDVVWEQPFNNFMKELVIESNGVIKFALAGASAIAENGLVAKLQFVSNDEATMDQTEVSLIDLRVNESPVIKLASTATLSRSLGTDDRIGIPDEFAIKQNYPNPFNPVTRILYDIPEASHVTITIYNLLGNQVKTLVSGYQEPGYKTILWNATNERGAPVSAGMYLYSIKAGDFHQTKKMLLLK